MPEYSYSAKDIAQIAANAGFSGEALVIMTAVAMAESGGRPDAIGDVGLQNGTWGPSVGLWQVRSLNAQRGTGDTRDQDANLDPMVNARAAFEISGKGSTFSPWSAYTNGAYAKFLAVAKEAAAGVSSDGTLAKLDGLDSGDDLHDPASQADVLRDMINQSEDDGYLKLLSEIGG